MPRPFSGHGCSSLEVGHRGLFAAYLCDVISVHLPGKCTPDSGHNHCLACIYRVRTWHQIKTTFCLDFVFLLSLALTVALNSKTTERGLVLENH